MPRAGSHAGIISPLVPRHTRHIAIHRWAARAAPHVEGPILAAAVFEPNVFLYRRGLGILATFADRRKDEAVDAGTGLARTTLLVVTARRIYAFDAHLLRWWNRPRPVAEWERSEVTARAAPLAPPENPLQHTTERSWPALQILDASGTCVADVQPYGWRSEHEQLFEVLTGAPGWPPTPP